MKVNTILIVTHENSPSYNLFLYKSFDRRTYVKNRVEHVITKYIRKR